MIKVLARHNASLDVTDYAGLSGTFFINKFRIISLESEIFTRIGNLFVALHAAASLGHSKCVRTLIDAGANMNAKDRLGKTPLHSAAFLVK